MMPHAIWHIIVISQLTRLLYMFMVCKCVIPLPCLMFTVGYMEASPSLQTEARLNSLKPTNILEATALFQITTQGSQISNLCSFPMYPCC